MPRSRARLPLAANAKFVPLLAGIVWLFAGAAARSGDAPPLHSASKPRPESAVVVRGEHIARIICSACHVVAPDQEYPPLLDTPGPSFSDIANRPGTTQRSLRHFITTTHWDEQTLPMTMPNPMLPPEDTRAVASYIVSLRAH
jgi:mono/diheme cytochrome c family protein